MQKRIVVLGGVGFIGSHLCSRLLREGNEVFCVDLREANNAPLLRSLLTHPEFRYVHHNIVNPFGIRCDQIYNMAAPSRVRYNTALPVETLKLNMLGSINALDAARTEHARVVYSSSGVIYGLGYRDVASETANDTSTHQIIADSKRAGEALHRAYQSEFGVDARIARIFNAYGSGGDLLDQRVVMKMIMGALQNRDISINGSGEQLRTFCWVEDIVDGLIRLMEAPKTDYTRTINLGSNHEISIRGLAEKIVSLTGSRSRIVHTESRADDPRRRTPDISAARRELGWVPETPLAEGLRRTISYVEKELSERANVSATWAEMS